MKICKLIVLLIALSFSTLAQEQDLMGLLDSQQAEQTSYTTGTFKSVRLINGYTSETAGKNDLVFSISHRFGNINGGAYELFGLDHSTIRFGFEYGLGNRISLGLGRSSHEKLYDSFIKLKITQQSTGFSSFPLTITWLSGMAVKTLKWSNPELDYPFSSRLYYVHELFIARKFNKAFSAQLVPVILHRNMVQTAQDQNLVSAVGVGANYTLNKWLSFSGEYYYLLPGYTADNFENSLSLGIEIESGGGHIFQINISNSQGMTEKIFIPETTGKWIDGDIALGFNIIRVF